MIIDRREVVDGFLESQKRVLVDYLKTHISTNAGFWGVGSHLIFKEKDNASASFHSVI